MRAKATSILIAAIFGLGVGGSWRLVSGIVEAAPKDVQGSPNVAVDTYSNSRGSFVLMSDGTVFSVKNGTTGSGVAYTAGVTDLGHPYSAPPAAAGITPPTAVSGRVVGSPNVAVKALVRSDATYVAFTDGKLRKPANADAAAAGASQRILQGMLLPGSPGCPYAAAPGAEGYSASSNFWASGMFQIKVTFDTPFSSTPSVALGGPAGYSYGYTADAGQFTATFSPSTSSLPSPPAPSGAYPFITFQTDGTCIPSAVAPSNIYFAAIGN